MDKHVVETVNNQIDRVRPIILAHGGGVQIIKATQKELVLKLEGHCANCAMAPMTFGLVLEKYIREALPELEHIRYTI